MATRDADCVEAGLFGLLRKKAAAHRATRAQKADDLARGAAVAKARLLETWLPTAGGDREWFITPTMFACRGTAGRAGAPEDLCINALQGL